MRFLAGRHFKSLSLVVLLLIVLTVIKWAFVEQFDPLAFDLALRIRGAQPPDPSIVIVSIDDGSLAEVGHWPWDEKVISLLFDRILNSEPDVIGLDLLLPAPQTRYPKLAGSGKVVVGTALGWSAKPGGGQLFWQEEASSVQRTPEDQGTPPGKSPPEEAAPDRNTPAVDGGRQRKPPQSLTFGHIHADKDLDGICRSIPLSVSYSGRRRWAFSLELARLHLQLPEDQLSFQGTSLKLGSIALPRQSEPIDAGIDALGVLPSSTGDHLLINYRGGPQTFRHVAASDILQGRPEALAKLRKRIVLLGATAYSLGDHLSTAFSSHNETPGVEIHANALDTILNHRFIRTLTETESVLLLSLVAIWTVSLFSGWPRNWTIPLILLTLVAVVFLPPFLLIVGSIWVPWVTLLTGVVVPCMAAQLGRFITFNRQLNHQFKKLAQLLHDSQGRGVSKQSSPELSLFRRQRLEWKLRVLGEASRRALRVAAVKEETLSFLSHELKTPLTSIRGFADLLLGQDQLSEKDRTVSLTLIRNESRRLNKLINDYLDLARLEHGARSPTFEDCSLNAVLAESWPLVQPQLKEKRMTLEYREPAERIECQADAGLLTQVVINLLGNAVKYSPPDTHLTLTLSALDNLAEVKVADQGYGISEEDLKQLFRKFFRGSPRSESEVPGSGLGLAFVQKVVELHGGEVLVESEVGAGSTFAVRIPCRRATPQRDFETRSSDMM